MGKKRAKKKADKARLDASVFWAVEKSGERGYSRREFLEHVTTRLGADPREWERALSRLTHRGLLSKEGRGASAVYRVAPGAGPPPSGHAVVEVLERFVEALGASAAQAPSAMAPSPGGDAVVGERGPSAPGEDASGEAQLSPDDSAHGPEVGSLRAMRRAAGLAPERAAELLGVSTTALAAWESGLVEPKPEVLEALRAAIDAAAIGDEPDARPLGSGGPLDPQGELPPAARAPGHAPSGAALRSKREDLGLSQRRVAELAGLPDQPTVSALERGKQTHERRAWAIHDALERVAASATRDGLGPGPQEDASGSELRAAREALRLSQARASELLGVSRSSFCCWENGTRKPRGTTIAAAIEDLRARAKAEGIEPDRLEARWAEEDATGAQLRAARKARRLTLAAAAGLLGVGLSTLDFWELGRSRPKGSSIAAMIARLEVAASDAGIEPDPSGAFATEEDATGGELRAARVGLGLSQVAAGRLLGVSGTTVLHWEKGYSKPMSTTISATIDLLRDAVAAPKRELAARLLDVAIAAGPDGLTFPAAARAARALGLVEHPHASFVEVREALAALAERGDIAGNGTEGSPFVAREPPSIAHIEHVTRRADSNAALVRAIAPDHPLQAGGPLAHPEAEREAARRVAMCQPGAGELTGRGVLRVDFVAAPGYGERSGAEREFEWEHEWATLLAASPELAEVGRVELALTGDFGFWPHSVGELLRSPHLRGLESLELTGAHLTGWEYAEEIARSPSARALSSLALRADDQGDFGHEGHKIAQHLAGSELFATSRTLRELSIEGGGIGDDGAMALAGAPALSALLALELADNGLGPEGLAALARAALSGGLERLDVSQNPIGDEGVAELLLDREFASVRALSLSGCRVTSAGAALLAREPRAQGVERLELGDNDFSPAAAELLLDAFGARVVVLGERELALHAEEHYDELARRRGWKSRERVEGVLRLLERLGVSEQSKPTVFAFGDEAERPSGAASGAAPQLSSSTPKAHPDG